MIHAKDDGNTLLHFASRVGNMLLIRRLLQQGEDINAKNKQDKQALDIAEQYQECSGTCFRQSPKAKGCFNRTIRWMLIPLAGVRLFNFWHQKPDGAAYSRPGNG